MKLDKNSKGVVVNSCTYSPISIILTKWIFFNCNYLFLFSCCGPFWLAHDQKNKNWNLKVFSKYKFLCGDGISSLPTYRWKGENWPQTNEVILGTILGNSLGTLRTLWKTQGKHMGKSLRTHRNMMKTQKLKNLPPCDLH